MIIVSDFHTLISYFTCKCIKIHLMYVRKMLLISFTKCSVCFVYLYEVFLGDAFGPLYTHLCSPTWITDVRTLYQHALYQRAVFRGGQLVYNCHTVRWASPTLMKKYIISISSLREREREREYIFIFELPLKKFPQVSVCFCWHSWQTCWGVQSVASSL